MNVRIQYAVRFMGGVYYDNRLQMNEYTVNIYMMTNTYNTEDHNIALNRIKYFICNELENTIFINGDDEACYKLSEAGLDITTLPGDPVDQLIGIMLLTKLTAIAESKMLVGEIEVSSVLGDGIVYIHSENEKPDDLIIPDWWESVDLVHCDQDLIDSEKVVTMHKSSVWRDLDLQWTDIDDDDPDDPETGNTVVFADFKRLDDTK